eukprot:g3564.t1
MSDEPQTKDAAQDAESVAKTETTASNNSKASSGGKVAGSQTGGDEGIKKKKSISASSLVASVKKQASTVPDVKSQDTGIGKSDDGTESNVKQEKQVVVEVKEEPKPSGKIPANSGALPNVDYKSIVNRKHTFFELYCTKGSVSNYITFVILLISVFLYAAVGKVQPIPYILSFGLFGFAGGFTNWLAVKMLFDKIPFLYGSGVIPRQFKEIRETVKTTIMATFFDEQYLGTYLNDRSKDLLGKIDLEGRIKKIVDDPSTEELIAAKLQEMAATPEGAFLAMVPMMMPGMTMRSIAALMKPALAGFATEMATKMKDSFDITEFVSVDNVRDEIDALMTEKLQELTPPIVKKLMEDVIREHLGWLIIWGNIFGGALGLISQAVGYGV